MRPLKLGGLVLSLLGLAMYYVKAHAQQCPEHFLEGQEPVITNERLEQSTRKLCFQDFGVFYSGQTRTPLWSAEHLTIQQLDEAKQVHRVNAFHVEKQLLPDEQSKPSDYVRSGFDRGHLAPAADMSTKQSQYESFSLANIVPQHPENNRNIWEGIEFVTQSLTYRYKEVFVVTGVLFKGGELQRLNGRVYVPTHLYKAIYIPALKKASAYVVENYPTRHYEIMSITELEKFAGIHAFPALPDSVKTEKMELPQPRTYMERKRQEEH